MAAGWTLGALYSSSLVPAAANRAILHGPVFVVSGLTLAAVFVPHSDSSLISLTGVSLSMIAVGTGIGLAWPHLLTRVLANVPDREKDIAGASITTVQLIATAIGAALAGGTAPLLATWMLKTYDGSWVPIAWYIVGTAVISLIGIAFAKTVAEND